MAAPEFREVAEFEDTESGLVLVVTKSLKKHKGGSFDSFSWSVYKQFTRHVGGESQVERTVWRNRRHVVGTRRLLDRLEEWFDRELGC